MSAANGASTKASIRDLLIQVATDCIEQGPGFAQEPVVLRTALDKLGDHTDLEEQQRILTVWQDLFREGILSWGYDLLNPAPPFFHLARR